MKLLNCQIVNFGCLSDRSFTFDEGLNLLYAPNGQGKSTFAVFLKAMLYGLPPINKRALQESERKRYMPWQGGSFGGALCFEAEGVEYRLERFFGDKEKDDRFALYHLATGNPSNRYTENIGVELFGVDADGFERSLYISQRAPFASPDNNSIRARLGSLLDASDDLGNFERADKLLDDARRHYAAQGGRGFIAELTDAIREKDAEILAAKDAGACAARLREERDALEQGKTELTSSLEGVKIKRAEAEKRRIWEEQNASYRSLCETRDAEKRHLSPLEEFFAPHLPTDEELLEADNAVAECTTLSAQIDACTMSTEDDASLSALRERYGAAAPTGAFMERMRTALSAWRQKRDKLSSIRSRVEGQKDPLLSRFADCYPTDAQVAGIRAAKGALEDAQARLYAQEERTERKSTHALPLIGAAVLALLAVLGFILSSLPLAIPALLLSLASFVFFFVLRRGSDERTQRSNESLRVLEERLTFLLLPFGYSDRSALLAASRFFDDLARYDILKRDEEQTARLYESAKEEENAAREILYGLLGSEVEDPEAAVAKIEADLPVFNLLLQKEAGTKEQRGRLLAEHERLSAKLAVFLSHFTELSALSPRAALDQIKQNLLLCRQTLDRYGKARRRVDEYLSVTRFDPDAPPPPYLGELRMIDEELDGLQRSLTELESQCSVKGTEAKRQSEIASTLPSLLAERDALLKKQEEAEHTLSLIRTAKDTLKEAKDDLATRYLRDMELYFDHYYQKVTVSPDAEPPADGSRISSFSMDTSLTLSTETYGERRPISVLSRGEYDLVAFCARLSLMEAIFTAETPFLLLDDPFINLDDENYKKATALLSHLAERFQIVYTVCSRARLPGSVALKTIG